MQVYELRSSHTGLHYVAAPPAGVPAAALVAAAVSRALGCPLPLPLAPLFECGEAALETVQDVLLPSRGTHESCLSAVCIALQPPICFPRPPVQSDTG